MIRNAWASLVFALDDLNHKILLRRRISNRLCDYNERLITGETGD